MSIEAAYARVAEINRALTFSPQQVQAAQATAATAPASATGASGTPSFQQLLGQAQGASPTASAAALSGPVGQGAQGVINAARAEVGVAEQPPGSNDSPRIREYRSAAGSPGPGPWCAYFTSWCARQAGVPIGPNGSGFGSVDAVWSWAQQTGRTSQTPQPGDLVVWDEHIGIVESVGPNGQIQTIEGNSSDKVSRRTHAAGDAIGYVRLG